MSNTTLSREALWIGLGWNLSIDAVIARTAQRYDDPIRIESSPGV